MYWSQVKWWKEKDVCASHDSLEWKDLPRSSLFSSPRFVVYFRLSIWLNATHIRTLEMFRAWFFSPLPTWCDEMDAKNSIDVCALLYSGLLNLIRRKCWSISRSISTLTFISILARFRIPFDDVRCSLHFYAKLKKKRKTEEHSQMRRFFHHSLLQEEEEEKDG